MTIDWATVRDSIEDDPRDREEYFDWSPEGKAFRVLLTFRRPMSAEDIAAAIGWGHTEAFIREYMRRRTDLFEECELDEQHRFQLVGRYHPKEVTP